MAYRQLLGHGLEKGEDDMDAYNIVLKPGRILLFPPALISVKVSRFSFLFIELKLFVDDYR
ncbi:MAG: hypothetical protein ACJAWL_001894 [Motiliproteus sp.]